MYAEDSFYSLTLFGRLGNFAISGLLLLAAAALAVLLMRGRRGPVRLAVAALIFTFFVWLSAQVYFEFSRMLDGDVPREWIIGVPPPFDALVGLVTFTGPATLSAHASGVLFWALVWLAWRLRPRAARAVAPDR